jgi:hypothetical protein
MKTVDMVIPFRWMGNKSRLLQFFGDKPNDYKRIIEPYAGSMTYSFNMSNDNQEIVGYEIDENALGIWDWLSNVSDSEFEKLEKWYNGLPPKRFDLRDCSLPQEVKNWVSLGGAMLPVYRNVIYPGEKRPNWKSSKKAIELLRTGRVKIIEGSCHELLETRDGDLLFVDPPYYESGEDYGNEDYRPTQTITMLEDAKLPSILTYGDFAPEHFPCYEWEVITRKILSKPTKGTTKRERMEYVSWVNVDRERFHYNPLEIFLK